MSNFEIPDCDKEKIDHCNGLLKSCEDFLHDINGIIDCLNSHCTEAINYYDPFYHNKYKKIKSSFLDNMLFISSKVIGRLYLLKLINEEEIRCHFPYGLLPDEDKEEIKDIALFTYSYIKKLYLRHKKYLEVIGISEKEDELDDLFDEDKELNSLKDRIYL